MWRSAFVYPEGASHAERSGGDVGRSVRVYQRNDRNEPDKLAEARRMLAEVRLERAINMAIKDEYPITREQRERLALLLTGTDLQRHALDLLAAPECTACDLARDMRGTWRHRPACPIGKGRGEPTYDRPGRASAGTTKEETP